MNGFGGESEEDRAHVTGMEGIGTIDQYGHVIPRVRGLLNRDTPFFQPDPWTTPFQNSADPWIGLGMAHDQHRLRPDRDGPFIQPSRVVTLRSDAVNRRLQALPFGFRHGRSQQHGSPLVRDPGIEDRTHGLPVEPSKGVMRRIELQPHGFGRNPQGHGLCVSPNIHPGAILVLFQLHHHGDAQAIGRPCLLHCQGYPIARSGIAFDARLNNPEVRRSFSVHPLREEP